MATRCSRDERRLPPTTAWVTGTLILLATLAGCGSRAPSISAGGVRPAESVRQPGLAPGCPPAHAPPGGGQAAVDYVDFLQANGRNYIADLAGNRVRISPSDLGPVALQVRCSYAAVNDATGLVLGEPRDGDSAFLAPGTRVYTVRGWSPLCRLAAMHDHVLLVYLAYRPDVKVATPEPCALNRS